MAAIFAFICSDCGRVHEGSPSYAFKAPDQYACLTEEQKASMARISSDFCTITHDGGTDYFIRNEAPVAGDGFFGWVCNEGPWYPPAGSRSADKFRRP